MIRLHPLSALLGAAIVGLCLLTMSQMRVAAAVIGVEYLPHPRDMVQIVEGTPYTVPAGKILVITGLGVNQSFNQNASFVSLTVNGQVVLSALVPAFSNTGTASASTVVPTPAGLTAQAGSIVEPAFGSGGPDARTWGYLAAQ